MERIRHRADFLAAASGARAPAGGFVLQSRQRTDGEGPARVGFTVSRKVGHATERNRVRRRLREIVRLVPATSWQAGCDYVLIGRKNALELPFERLAADLGRAMRRVATAEPAPDRRAEAGRTQKAP